MKLATAEDAMSLWSFLICPAVLSEYSAFCMGTCHWEGYQWLIMSQAEHVAIKSNIIYMFLIRIYCKMTNILWNSGTISKNCWETFYLNSNIYCKYVVKLLFLACPASYQIPTSLVCFELLKYSHKVSEMWRNISPQVFEAIWYNSCI